MTEPRLTLRPWRAGDQDAFTPRADLREAWAATPLFADGAAPPGRTWTLVRGEEVVGVGGGHLRAPDLWEAWSCLACLGSREWPRALLLARAALQFLELECGATRIYAAAFLGHAAARRTLERLAFRWRGDEGDFAIMVRGAWGEQ